MYKVIFLGDRRIAAQSLQMLAQTPYRNMFNISAIVSSPAFIDNASGLDLGNFVGITNEKRKSQSIKEIIASENINLLISVQHNWILSEEILDQVELAFNLHNAKLPEYKGYNSVSHSIINRDKLFYSTLHWMAEEVDTGDIAYEGVSEINDHDTALSLYEKTVDASKIIFKELLDDLCENRLPPRREVTNEGVFYGKNDLTFLKDITGIEDQVECDYRIRGSYFPPHEPAFMKISGKKVYLIPEDQQYLYTKELPAYTTKWNK